MMFRVPSAVAPLAVAPLLALALAACQSQEPPEPTQAAAPAEAAVATAVRDVHSAAIDPATGKARDASAVFINASDTGAAAAPGVTLGGQAPGAPSTTLDIAPGTTGTGEPSY